MEQAGKSLNEESGGIANNNPNYVMGLGFIIAGHCQHHVNLIRERYLK